MTFIARPVRRAGGGLGGTMDDWRTFQSLLVSSGVEWRAGELTRLWIRARGHDPLFPFHQAIQLISDR